MSIDIYKWEPICRTLGTDDIDMLRKYLKEARILMYEVVNGVPLIPEGRSGVWYNSITDAKIVTDVDVSMTKEQICAELKAIQEEYGKRVDTILENGKCKNPELLTMVTSDKLRVGDIILYDMNDFIWCVETDIVADDNLMVEPFTNLPFPSELKDVGRIRKQLMKSLLV